jgi:hypothetical protein
VKSVVDLTAQKLFSTEENNILKYLIRLHISLSKIRDNITFPCGKPHLTRKATDESMKS